MTWLAEQPIPTSQGIVAGTEVKARVHLWISREKRAVCSACGLRRVLFRVVVMGRPTEAFCAGCWGVR